MRTGVAVFLVIVAATAGWSSPATSATQSEVMASRYMKYQFCMEKAYGQGFDKKLGLDLVLNRWGASEPTLASLAKTPAPVQKVEAQCRTANELGLEPRPR